MKTYTKAVSATLAGALAVGMVPAMALADAPDAELDLLLADPEAAGIAGEIVIDGFEPGAKVEVGSDDLDKLFPAYVAEAVSGEKLEIVQVLWAKKGGSSDSLSSRTLNGEKVRIVGTWETVTAADWATTQPAAPGEYYMIVNAKASDGTAIAVAEVFPFTVTPKSLDGAYLYNATGSKDDEQEATEGTSFVYNGTDQEAKLALSFGVGDKTLIKGTDYTLDVLGAAAFQNAGEYVVRIKGGDEFEGYSKDVKVTMETLDLSEAAIVLNGGLYAVAGTALPTNISSVNAKSIAGLTLELQSATTGQLADPESKPGKYVYRVAVADPENKNIVSYQDITAVRYGAPAVIKYDGKTTGWATIDAENPFDPDEISVVDNDKDKKALPYDVVYKKEDLTVPAGFVYVDEDELTLPGEYTAVVTVNDPTYAYGGTLEIDFEVEALAADDDQTFVYYNGVLKGADFGVQYTGSDILADIDFKVLYKGKELVKGTDYELKVTCDGKVVTEIVDVEDYTITVVPAAGSMYKFEGDFSIDVEVTPVTPVAIRVADQVTVKQSVYDAIQDKYVEQDVTGLAYTGEVITPSFEYYTQDDLDAALVAAQKKYNDATLTATDAKVLAMVEWHVLPADVYTATIEDRSTVAQKADGKIQELGDYDFTVKTAKKVVNYNLNGLADAVTQEFKVINGSIFKDVPAGKWYTEAVMKAYSLDYMKGIGNDLFDPMGKVTRGQAACILYNMAGGVAAPDGSINNMQGFVTGFDDVASNMWYAEAVAWAGKAGIVNGWTEGGKQVFGPNQEITREQWACMLGNYAKVYGGFKAPAADALAGFADAGKVSSWAKESVAWAVENGIMGNGGAINAKASIIRAEAAAMAVNFQPQKLA